MKMIVGYSRNSMHVSATHDYLIAFKKFWPNTVNYIHITNDAVIGDRLSDYDVVFHNYCGRLCFEGYVSNDYKRALREFQGVKVLSVQDEYDRTNHLKSAILDLGFDVVLTCVPQDQIELIYPRSEFPDVRFVTVLTGYMTADDTQEMPPRVSLEKRKNFIGYRGRNIGLRYGQLGFDKYEIGRRAIEMCALRDVQHDISMSDEDRIYGEKWGDFIRSCRVMLGSESGSNVFDFDGKIEKKLAGVMCDAPSARRHLEKLEPLESRYNMGQVSPRVFECIQNFTPMVLFEGRYSEVVQPNLHYIPLKKDFSNFEEVLEKIEDVRGLEEMADRAFRHVVDSGRFNYRAFVKKVEDVVAEVSRNEQKGEQLQQEENCVSLSHQLASLPAQFPSSCPKTLPIARVEQSLEILSRVLIPRLDKLLGEWDRQLEFRKMPENFSTPKVIANVLRGWARICFIVAYQSAYNLARLFVMRKFDAASIGREMAAPFRLIIEAGRGRNAYRNKSDWLMDQSRDLKSQTTEQEHVKERMVEAISKGDVDEQDMQYFEHVVKMCSERSRHISKRIIELRF